MTLGDLAEAAGRIRAAAVAADPGLTTLPIAGIGWATVEHERAMLELDAALGPDVGAGPQASWTQLDRDPTLGARVWERSDAGAPTRPAVLVLEPDTEGRLAASLARFGEAVAVVYLGDGPVGAGRLIRGGRPWGPHVVVL